MSVVEIVAEQDVRTGRWEVIVSRGRVQRFHDGLHRHQVEGVARRMVFDEFGQINDVQPITYRPASKRRGVKRARES